MSLNNCGREGNSKIISSISELFSKAIESEIQEKVLCHALEMFGLWSTKFTGEIPTKIVQAFKKGLESKSQIVRISYLQWFLACLKHGHLPSGVTFTNDLTKLVDKAAQNPTQPPIVTEGLSAACIILLILNDSTQDSLQQFWNIVLDMNKQIFVNEKFLGAAHNTTPYYVALMCQKLLLEHFDSVKGPVEPLYKAIVVVATSPDSKVRQLCRTILQEILLSKNGVDLAKDLLQDLTTYIQTAKVKGDGDEHSIPPQAFIDAILGLTNRPGIETVDGQQLALGALLCSHFPEIVNVYPSLWETILSNLQLEGKAVIMSNREKVYELVIDSYKPTPMFENTLATLTKLCPGVVLPKVMPQIFENFAKPEMAEVKDEEYFTFLTPDGELYDKTVLPDFDASLKIDHMKRENKAYSYKEQIEELQLRREIEEKKRKEGKWKPPQLTPKQKEAIKAQTDKENAIKARLKSLNEKIQNAVSQIRGAAKGNPKQLSIYFNSLLPSILRILRSPLAAPVLTKLYYDLKSTCYTDDWDALGSSIAIATLRLAEPKCDLDDDWQKVELGELLTTTLDDLYGETVEIINDEANETAEDKLELMLEVPTFCYAFEFLKRALLTKNLESDEDLLIKGIQIIGVHAQTRGFSEDATDPEDYRHPKHLPRLELMRLLLNLISVHRGRVQAQAVAAFLEVR